MQKPSETEILEGINAKNREALLELFEMYYAPLKFFAKKLIDRDMEDDEMIEGVFLKLQTQKHFETINGLRAFLYGSVKNSCLDRVRQEPAKFNLLTEKMINQNADKYILETEYLRLTVLEMEKA